MSLAIIYCLNSYLKHEDLVKEKILILWLSSSVLAQASSTTRLLPTLLDGQKEAGPPKPSSKGMR